ncbi:ABC drug exporter AbcA [Histoplasma capsulatum H143]|uniref:ABC drug exporter AbcA n=1 Tax=Ajellomyces capsulatus (strain H143) TaxID=544712 RepID=C6HKR3_AJECH|nr:ABC drug exporter AbcA [Histoplasma capsulatum H143]
MGGTSLSSISPGDPPGDNPDDEMFGERLNENIAKVASRASISSTSAQTIAQSRALSPAPGSNLDPSSAAFDARAWVQDFIRVCESDPKSAPSRALGVAFRRLNVFGWGAGAEYQRTTGSVVSEAAKWLARFAVGKYKGQRVDILRDFEGVVEKGEMLLVLGPPGSGCSTLLKSLSGETQDLSIEPDSHIDFRGVGLDHIRSSLRGDVLYNAEHDTHLAPLTVNETLTFASRARSPRHVPGGTRRHNGHLWLDTHLHTRVGDDFVRGVSGGERKRVMVDERKVKPGFEDRVPRTANEFAARWQASKERQALLLELDNYPGRHPPAQRLEEYHSARRAEQAKFQRPNSAYTISYTQQVSLTLWRAYRRLLADPGYTVSFLLFNAVMAIILGTMYFDLKEDTSSFYYRAGAIFFSLLSNAFGSQLEVLTIYDERPVVEKQNRFAFYHYSSQAIASYLIDLPYKVGNMFVFNIIIYFMTNLRLEAGAFFFFCLTTFLATLVQSAIFRTLACLTRTAGQAMIPSAVLGLGLTIYTGFTTPPNQLPGWSRWMARINPLAYGFEALIANEFHNRDFPCASFVPRGPGYENLPSISRICSVVGSEAGSAFVSGDGYINTSFNYSNGHKWRNIGIMFAFLAFFFPAYLLAAELAKPPQAKGEVLVFRRTKAFTTTDKKIPVDPENQLRDRPVFAEKSGTSSELAGGITGGTDVFHWEDLCYDIKIKNEERRLLDHVDGWVKPGVSTVLMGVSGAGKTTLLDVLATRVTTGIVSGDTMINGELTDASFQHKVGYVQQQDLHLSTATVREALQFSALLRQPSSISRAEKLQYAEKVIDMLEIRELANAVIGVPGEGLNIEQRKRLTIGVELAARPQLLIFFDEPTSGLDSQTSWAISELVKKLTNSGQAVLCTVHQPSAILFGQFDRLLLIAPGGKTVYFGDLGKGSSRLIDYFERNNAFPCPKGANPAEWMLEVIQPPADGSKGPDWHQIWLDSPEYTAVKSELQRLRSLPTGGINPENGTKIADEKDHSQHQEFVTSFWTQVLVVLRRTFRHYWRSPAYIWTKTILIALSTIYLGFSFRANNTIQGMTNQLWAIFMLFIPFININEQIMPMFLPQRALFEVRERPSKIYRWSTFILSNIIVELFWNTLMAVLMYFCWYYPIGFVQNTKTDDQAIRGFLVFLLLWTYMLFTSTIAHFAITWIDMPDTAGILTSFMWLMCIFFCGIGVRKQDIPKFWTFMYRLSPATYLVGGLMSSAVANSEVHCAPHEILEMRSVEGSTCGEFLSAYIESAGGMVLNPGTTDICRYCTIASSNEFLAGFHIYYDTRWKDFGLMWVYILFNIIGALSLYWGLQSPEGQGQQTCLRAWSRHFNTLRTLSIAIVLTTEGFRVDICKNKYVN